MAKKPEVPPLYAPKETREKEGFNLGSGFFISDSGYFITNYHVVEDARELVIKLEGGTIFTAEIIASDLANDTVVGKVDARTVPIPLFNGQASKGEEVFTLGYPLISAQGQEQKATLGRINALSGVNNDVRFYQVDTPIQPGNSGGPIINSHGEVVGVVTATLDEIATLRESGALGQNVNYAVKIAYIFPILNSSGLDFSVTSENRKLHMIKIADMYEKPVLWLSPSDF